MLRFLRPFVASFLFLLTSACFAGTLTVTSPTDGSFVGATNQLRFLVRQASVEVTVRAQITGPGGTTSVEGRFTPNAQGEIDNSLPLNFSSSNPEGTYTIVVTATEPGNTYNSVTLTVTLDITKPRFLQFSPLPGSYVKGIVPISVLLDEPNVKEWRVQINGQDIPNNTGTDSEFTVFWDTAGIELDGSQTITVRVKDEAENEETRTINVTLDRVQPVITIQYPRSVTPIRPRSTISVVVDVQDATATAVDVTGLDVIVQRLDGTFITRVARTAVRSIGGNTVRWSGRIRWRSGLLPNQFKIVVTAIDRAGNLATPQEVILTLGR
ncbi:MAG TPA: hypothetical protein VM328_13545 [Fimbriimonadaceae bacterium]|nr:hypothetical protein [Fimbriimonadaceae bacterium]